MKSSQTSGNLWLECLRQCVFQIEAASANHTTRIIFAAVESKRLHKLLNEDFHAEFSCGSAGAADELRGLIKDARKQWAVQLRDSKSRDIEIIVEHEKFGNGRDARNEARLRAVRKDLDAAGGDIYHWYPFNKENNRAVLCVVISQDVLEAVLTEQRMAGHAIKFNDITAPAPEDGMPTPPNPGCMFWYRNADESTTILPTPKDRIRHRSNSIERVIRQAPRGAWDPYSRPQTVAQQEWIGRKPFSAEIYEPESNGNWPEPEFAIRCQELEDERIAMSKKKIKNVKMSDDGTTIWEEPWPSHDEASEDIIIGKPPSDDEGERKSKWAWIQRLFAGSGRSKSSSAKTSPAKTPPATRPSPPDVTRRDSAVSFSSDLAIDIATGKTVKRDPPKQATTNRRQLLGAPGFPRPTEEVEQEQDDDDDDDDEADDDDYDEAVQHHQA